MSKCEKAKRIIMRADNQKDVGGVVMYNYKGKETGRSATYTVLSESDRAEALAEIDAMDKRIEELEAENKKLRVNGVKDMVIISDLQAKMKRYRDALEDIEAGICFSPECTAGSALTEPKESEK